MRLLLIAAGLITSGALGVFVRRMRHRRDKPDIDPVTKEWLAEAASREDHAW